MEIEHNIPIPSKHTGPKTHNIEILKRMNVGDSIVTTRPKVPGFLSSAKRVGYKMTTRAINPSETRVWRIA